jgi:hypothetical protein
VLALIVVSALSAVAASTASAQGKLTSDGPVTLTATETGVSLNSFTAFGVPGNCTVSYTGHAHNVTPHTFIPSGATTVTLTPKFGPCTTVPSGFPGTVDMNGCDYVVHIGATTDQVDTYALTFDVVCPAGKEMTVTFFTSSADHINNKPHCIWHIKEQLGLKGLHITDTTNGTLDITGTVEKLHVTRVSPGNSHPLLCNSLTTTEGKIHIDVTVKGLNEAGAATNISLSH